MTLADTVPTGWASRLLIAGLIVAAGALPAAAADPAPATPTTLADAIQLALRQNSGLQDSQDDVAKAQLSLQAAKAGSGLTLVLDRTYSYSQFFLDGSGSHLNDISGEEKLEASKPLGSGSLSGSIEWDPKVCLSASAKKSSTCGNPINYSLGLSEPLLPSLPNPAALALQKATRGVADKKGALAADRDALVLKVEAAYLNAQKHALTVSDAHYALDDAQSQLARVKARVAAGQAGAGDVQSAQIALGKAQAKLDADRYDLQDALESLDTLLGLPPDSPLALADVTAPQFDVTLSAAQTQAAAQRREIATARQNLQDAQTALDQAKKAAGLQVTGIANFSNSVGQPLSQANWSVGLEVDLPFFSGSNPQLAIDSAQIDVQGATRDLANSRRSVRDDVIGAYHDWLSAGQSLSIAKLEDQQAAQTFAAVKTRYAAGVATQDDVQDAQHDLGDADAAVSQAALGVRIAADQLKVAMGEHIAP